MQTLYAVGYETVCVNVIIHDKDIAYELINDVELAASPETTQTFWNTADV